MTRSEQIERMRIMIGDEVLGSDDDTLLSYYLDFAETRMLARRYPFGVPNVETWMDSDTSRMLQLEIAVFLFNKRGMEGESLHSENGVSRSYAGTMDVPPELLQQITPKGRVYA